jgi:hypothetical protein
MGEFEPVFPLKAIVFQILFLLVAIALEAGILRQRMRLGYQRSVQYAASINLLATVLGWILFLAIEKLPMLAPNLKAQIISYVMFNRLLSNSWSEQIGWIILLSGMLAFFATLVVKIWALESLMRLLGTWKAPEQPQKLSRDERYRLSRDGRLSRQQNNATLISAVLQANALSFSAILLLLFLRYQISGVA